MADEVVRGGPGDAPDLGGLQAEYRYRHPRAAVLLYGLTALVGAAAVLWDLADGSSRSELITHVVLTIAYVLLLVTIVTSAPRVVLDGEGLHVRSDYRWRTLRWADVVEVRTDASRRFPRAWLVSGRSVRLLGVPVEAGERLDGALRARRP